jgi:hypothetical protein
MQKMAAARRILALSLLAAGMSASLFGETAIAHGNAPALKFKHEVRQRHSSWYVDYVQFNGEPAFRVRVHHYHRWCNGYLYLTATRVAYVPQFTPSVNDGILIARPDIVDVKPRFSGYEISTQGKTYDFAFLSEPDAAFESGESEGRTDLLNFVGLALSDFAAAHRQFARSIVGSSSQDSSGATHFAAKPVIRILNSGAVINNTTLDAGLHAERVLGIAAAAGGIKAVTVNGAPATLVPISPEVVQFTGSELLLKDTGPSTVSISASSGDNAIAQIQFNLIRPAVRITQPVADGKVVAPTATLRGLVIGVNDLERVDLGGKNLALSKQLDGTFAFESASVPVNMGVNCIPGFLVRSNGERDVFWATVRRVPPGPPPLSLARIAGALRADVTNGRLIDLVNENGVDFQMTPETENQLRSLGANKALLDAITDSQK